MTARHLVKIFFIITLIATPIALTTDTFAFVRHQITSRTQFSNFHNFNRTDRHSPYWTATPRPNQAPQLTHPVSAQAASPSPTAQPANQSFTDQILTLTNQARAQQNLRPLTLHNNLNTSAQNYATQMATRNFFSHTAPGGETMQARITKSGYTPYAWIAENIAAGQTTPQQAFTGWLNSPGHRANILNPASLHLGVGYATSSTSTYRHYWVQHFGAK